MGTVSTPRLLLAALALTGCAAAPPPGPADPLDDFRADLRSPDPETALAAAMELEPESLDLEEIRIQARLLAEHPEEVLAGPGEGSCFLCEGGRSIGSPEVLRLLEVAVTRSVPVEEPSIQDLHRVMVPDHIPGLVALLEPAEGNLWRYLLWMLRLLADNTDRHRETVAGALLYARSNWVAEVEGRPWPRLADLRFPGDGPDTPAAFLQRFHGLLRGHDPGGWNEQFPWDWWRRWEGTAEKPDEAGVEAFTPEAARSRLETLARGSPPDDEEWDRFREEAPLLEAAAPEAMDALLDRWKDAGGDHGRWIREMREQRGRPPGEADRAEAEDVLAAIGKGEYPGNRVALLGLLGGRGRTVLERYRRERHHGLLWPATAGLAIAGDAGARSEFLAFLRGDRTFVYDAVFDPVGFTLNGDPEALAHWRSRVGSNCCLWFFAWEALRRWYPTMPAENRAGDPDGAAERARQWWERWKDRLAWSRIAGGWVPVAE